MPTRRTRKSRKSRKRKGGILGLSMFKTTEDNIRNCEKVWSDVTDPTKQPSRCRKSEFAGYLINYPSSRNIEPTYKTGKQIGQPVPTYSY